MCTPDRQGGQEHDVEISVHCDSDVFDWLLRYAQWKKLGVSPEPPRMTVGSCLAILLSSNFLKVCGMRVACVCTVQWAEGLWPELTRSPVLAWPGLQMDELVHECLEFLSANLLQISDVQVDFAALPSDLFCKLSKVGMEGRTHG